LGALFDALRKQYGAPVFGQKGKKLPPLPEKPLSAELTKALKALPQAGKVQDK
jgi:hypothetical protein